MIFLNRLLFFLLVLIFDLIFEQVHGEKLCARLFKENNFIAGSDLFDLNDGSQVSNFDEQYITTDTVWNETRSFRVAKNCVLTACNSSFFDGFCQDFKKSVKQLPPELDNLYSASCTCSSECKCSDIAMKKRDCARAYFKGGCNTCNTNYTDLKSTKEYFPYEFAGQVEAIKVREGCNLTIYEQEDWEGNFVELTDTQEVWNNTIGSYECSCSSYTPKIKPPRPDNYPVLVDIPESMDDVIVLMQGALKSHPGLTAAKTSLKNRRSSKNAYILVLGTTGSGKSTAINMLFDNANITKAKESTLDIQEYRISVPVDELGINNSELRIIDTPGLGTTRGLEQDAKFLATLEDYLNNHEELHDGLPNVVLIFDKFYDNAFVGQMSSLNKMLRGLDSFREKITDDKYSNVVFVFSHFCSETKEVTRRPIKRLQAFKSVIEEYTQFPQPIVIAVAENKAEDQELPMVNGFYKLPNGEYFPKNILDKIQSLTVAGGDPIGDAVIRTAFRDSDNFIVNASTYNIRQSGGRNVDKFLQLLSSTYNTEKTEVSQLLAMYYEKMDSKLKSKYPKALQNIQRALNIRNIWTKQQVPRTTFKIIELLSSLKKNEAIIFLLKEALDLSPPVFEENSVVGSGYNENTGSELLISPFQLGNLAISNIEFLLPSEITCTLVNQTSDTFKIMPSNLKLKFKPGFNILQQQSLNGSCSLTAIREYRTFSLDVIDNPKLTSEFDTAIQSLPSKVDSTDLENIQKWKEFFNEYGTHFIKSVYGGGSITIELKSNKTCQDTNIPEDLFQLIQCAEDLTIFNDTNFKQNRIQHSLKFRGGDPSFHTTDLTKMSLSAAFKLLQDWKKSLKLKPVILTTAMELVPISSVVGLYMSSIIETAAAHLSNSTLRFIQNNDCKTTTPPLFE